MERSGGNGGRKSMKAARRLGHRKPVRSKRDEVGNLCRIRGDYASFVKAISVASARIGRKPHFKK